MSEPGCPMCETVEALDHSERWECVTCGHGWERAPKPEAPAGPRAVKDAHGNVLTDGDLVMLIKDLPLKGSSQVLEGGTKSKPIRLAEGDHEISYKMDGVFIGSKLARPEIRVSAVQIRR
jgi:protein PhnA